MNEAVLPAVVAAASNFALFLVGYGMLKAQVRRALEDRRGDSERLEELQDQLASHRLQMLEGFVTFEAFREFRREVIQVQSQTNTKIDKLIEMVGGLRGPRQ